MMTNKLSKAVPALIAAVVIVVTLGAVRSGIVDFSTIHSWRDGLLEWIREHPGKGAAAFFLAYVTVAALSIPGAAIMTLLGGSLFGVLAGTALVSFASTTGATLAMLGARHLGRSLVERRFSAAMATVNSGIERDGAAYLFGLRLVPVVPFFVINLAMGLTQIPTWTFFWVSQLGMLPVTALYVNAGAQLVSIEDASDLLTWPLLLSLAAIAVAPFALKRLRKAWEIRRSAQALRANDASGH
ncbi:MAG: TVP38/TMEM64 family protein [Burkholderiales bacterium]|nr:TVP38/TMEM64 family protein [Burkholderiales bacterium]